MLQERLARIAQAVDEIHSSIEHPASLTPVYVRDEPVVDDVEEVVAYVPIAAEVQLPDDRGPMALGEVPAATVAVLTHHGGYDSIADPYQLLGRWVAEHAVSADLQVREAYVISPADHDDPARYRTDVCWPLDRWPTTTEGKTR